MRAIGHPRGASSASSAHRDRFKTDATRPISAEVCEHLKTSRTRQRSPEDSPTATPMFFACAAQSIPTTTMAELICEPSNSAPTSANPHSRFCCRGGEASIRERARIHASGHRRVTTGMPDYLRMPARRIGAGRCRYGRSDQTLCLTATPATSTPTAPSPPPGVPRRCRGRPTGSGCAPRHPALHRICRIRSRCRSGRRG